MRFMLHALQCTQNDKREPGCSVGASMKRNPPEVLIGDCPQSKRQAGTCKYNTKIVGVNAYEAGLSPPATGGPVGGGGERSPCPLGYETRERRT